MAEKQKPKPRINTDSERPQFRRAGEQTQEDQPKSSGKSDDQLRGDNQPKPAP
jgi:hypothetical protein